MLTSGLDAQTIVLSILYTIPAVLIALCFHEFAHAFAAYKLGDPTAKNSGRMTIDPTKHLDPLGTIFMFLFGFGWAKPVPVNARNFKNFRRDDIIVSCAGPVMNFFVSFVAAGLRVLFWRLGFLDGVADNILTYIIIYNIYIALFNLIPIPPLDGFHVVASCFIRKNTSFVKFLYRYGYIILLALLVTGAISLVFGTLTNIIWSGFQNFFLLFVL